MKNHLTCLLLFLVPLATVPAVAGCAGYQVGTHTLYQSDIHTVYVPVFESDSFRRNLGERLTEAVVKEIEFKTPYKVVGRAGADSVLVGKITRDRKDVVVENANDESRELSVSLAVQISWHTGQGETLRQAQTIPVPAPLVDVAQSTNLVPEVGQSTATAHQKAIERLAEQIVAMMEQQW